MLNLTSVCWAASDAELTGMAFKLAKAHEKAACDTTREWNWNTLVKDIEKENQILNI